MAEEVIFICGISIIIIFIYQNLGLVGSLQQIIKFLLLN